MHEETKALDKSPMAFATIMPLWPQKGEINHEACSCMPATHTVRQHREMEKKRKKKRKKNVKKG